MHRDFVAIGHPSERGAVIDSGMMAKPA